MLDGTALSLLRCNRLHYMSSLDSGTGSNQHRISSAIMAYAFGVLGDSSLYCKGSNHKPKKLGNRLWELLGSQVWYQTIAGAGVAELLETIRSGPQVDSLGVSYFGNDITRTPITTQVQADWKEFIQAVKLKSKRSVFVIGGYAAKFPSMRLSSTYDQNLQYVRSLVEREGLYVTDLRQKVQEWKLCSDGIHWHDDEKEDVCATWARLLRGQLPPSCHPDSEDFADDSEPPGGDAPHFKDTVRRVLQESITISTTVGDINPASPLMKNIA